MSVCLEANNQSVPAERIWIVSPVKQKFAELFACTKDPLVKGGRIALKAIRGDSCRQYEFAENLVE